ncbi:hypothetical protein [Parapedobacter sp. 10938]|uniref:hypothetical protein n=1 Tax=Parapedobacter flavus TaxID=3110225 RepID=UPI002DBE5F9A|nr:hypothetical protein [Parapedobacter sp. 10938]MEC3879394.1 hypothetical protein [Parapedobacter sp. 10938]
MRTLLTNWNPMRVIRLALGILIVVEGLRGNIIPLTVMGGAFAALALFNVGCGAGGCTVRPPKHKPSCKTNVEYEEVN